MTDRKTVLVLMGIATVIWAIAAMPLGIHAAAPAVLSNDFSVANDVGPPPGSASSAPFWMVTSLYGLFMALLLGVFVMEVAENRLASKRAKSLSPLPPVYPGEAELNRRLGKMDCRRAWFAPGWFQFSLRTLLVSVAVAGVGAGLLGQRLVQTAARVAEAKAEEDRVRALQAFRAQVERRRRRELQRRVELSVVEIITEEQGGGHSEGTGFIVGDGLVATAFHVIDNASSTTVRFHDGERANVSEVVAKDRYRDVAILRIPADKDLKPLRLASEVPRLDTRIFCFRPHHNTRHGKARLSYEGKVIFTAIVWPGWSGSPVVNIEGDVIGMTIQLRRDTEYFDAISGLIHGEGLAVPVTAIARALASDEATCGVSPHSNGETGYSAPWEGPLSASNHTSLYPRCGENGCRHQRYGPDYLWAYDEWTPSERQELTAWPDYLSGGEFRSTFSRFADKSLGPTAWWDHLSIAGDRVNPEAQLGATPPVSSPDDVPDLQLQQALPGGLSFWLE